MYLHCIYHVFVCILAICDSRPWFIHPLIEKSQLLADLSQMDPDFRGGKILNCLRYDEKPAFYLLYSMVGAICRRRLCINAELNGHRKLNLTLVERLVINLSFRAYSQFFFLLNI